MALMHLYGAYRYERPNAPQALIVTVDHGLRPEAKAEALFVAEVARMFGFEHRIAFWQGAKPQTALQAAARQARHQLLRDEALRYGTDCIVLGHTLNDQHETYAMRAVRTRDGRGLAAMAPATLFQRDIWLARPLLAEDRQSLRTYLRQNYYDWKDDPSNENPQFERIWMRQNLGGMDERPWKQAAQARLALNEAAAGYIKAHCHKENGLFIDDEVAAIECNPAARLSLAYGLALMGGRHYLPRAKGLSVLLSRLRHGPANLSRCLVRPYHGGLMIQREAREKTEMQLAPRQKALWDHRYWVENRSDSDVIIQGNDPRTDLYDGFIALGAKGEAVNDIASYPYLTIFDDYLPSFDINLAQIYAELFGRPAYPKSPL